MNTSKNRYTLVRLASALGASFAFTTMALAAQDSTSAAPAAGGSSAPSTSGEVSGEQLQAIVMHVQGSAQWRGPAVDGKEPAWRSAKVNDLLDPGSSIRTGLNSSLAVRVGKNATLLVDGNSVVKLPALTRDAESLRTVVQVKSGRVDIKVDHVTIDKVGLDNDFTVATPSTTLAVRGTWFAVSVGALAGFEILGARSNTLNAIELKYSLQNLRYFLSGNASSSSSLRDPVQRAWLSTLGPPAIAGLLTSLSEQEQQAAQGTTKADGATQTTQNARQVAESDTNDRGQTTQALTDGQLNSYASRGIDAEEAAAGLRDVWVTGRALAIAYRNEAQFRAAKAQQAVDAHVAAVDAAKAAAVEALVQLGFAEGHLEGAKSDHEDARSTLDGVLAKIASTDFAGAATDTATANALIDSAGSHATSAWNAASAADAQKQIAESANAASMAAANEYAIALAKTIEATVNSMNAAAITQQASNLCAQFAALSTSYAKRSTRDSALAAAANANALAVLAANAAISAIEARNDALAAAQFASSYGEMILLTAAADAAMQAAEAAGDAAAAAALAQAEANLAAGLRTEYAQTAAMHASNNNTLAQNASAEAIDWRVVAQQKEQEASDAKAAVVAAVAQSQLAAIDAGVALQGALAKKAEALQHLGNTQQSAFQALILIATGGDDNLLVNAPVKVESALASAALAGAAAGAAEDFRDAAGAAKELALEGQQNSETAVANFLAAVGDAENAATNATAQSDIAQAVAALAFHYSILATSLADASGEQPALDAATQAFASATAAGLAAMNALVAQDEAWTAANNASTMGDKVLFAAAGVALGQAIAAFEAAVTAAFLAGQHAQQAIILANQVDFELTTAQTNEAIERMMLAEDQADAALLAKTNAELLQGLAETASLQAQAAAQTHIEQVGIAQDFATQAVQALQTAITSRMAAEGYANQAQDSYKDTVAALGFNNLKMAQQFVGASQQAAANSNSAAADASNAAAAAAVASFGASSASALADAKATEYFSMLGLTQQHAQGTVAAAQAAEAAKSAAAAYAAQSGSFATAANTQAALDAAEQALNKATEAANSASAALTARDLALAAAETAGSMGEKVFFGAAAQFADTAASSAAQAAKEALMAQTAALAAANSANAANNAYQMVINGSGSGGTGSGSN